MKEFTRLAWVLVVQFISCWFSGWALSVTVFTLVVVLMWQLIFMNIITRVKNNSGNTGSDISGLPYLLFALPALFNPLLSVLLFSGLSVCRLCKTSGVTVGDKPFRETIRINSSAGWEDDDSHEITDHTNPSTGLPMSGLVDTGGNPYGGSPYNH